MAGRAVPRLGCLNGSLLQTFQSGIADFTGKLVSSGAPSKHKTVSASSKKARLNANAQKREQKRKDTVADVKFFSTSSGGGESDRSNPPAARANCTHAPGQVPRIVTVVPLISNLSPRRFILGLLPSLGLPEAELAEVASTISPSGTGSYLIRAPRFKTTLQINLLPPLALYQTLDAALVSDYVVLLMSATHEVQLEGEAVLRCLQAQCGGVEVVPAVQVSAVACLRDSNEVTCVAWLTRRHPRASARLRRKRRASTSRCYRLQSTFSPLWKRCTRRTRPTRRRCLRAKYARRRRGRAGMRDGRTLLRRARTGCDTRRLERWMGKRSGDWR
jgi:hypothetical protein